MGPCVLCKDEETFNQIFLFLSVILFLMEEKQEVANKKHTNNCKSAVCMVAPSPPLTDYEIDKYK